jgi:hypothetical protein
MLIFMPKSPVRIVPAFAAGRPGQAHETGQSGAFG